MIKNGEIAFIINTPSGKKPRADEVIIRGAAVTYRIPIMTTLSAAAASVNGIRSLQAKGLSVQAVAGVPRGAGTRALLACVRVPDLAVNNRASAR